MHLFKKWIFRLSPKKGDSGPTISLSTNIFYKFLLFVPRVKEGSLSRSPSYVCTLGSVLA